jgi:predicted transcriptional regulator
MWDAAFDDRLTRRDHQVYMLLLKHLDVAEFREVKLLLITHALKMQEARASESITRLVEYGYVKRGTFKANAVRRYRLVYSLRLPCRATPQLS